MTEKLDDGNVLPIKFIPQSLTGRLGWDRSTPFRMKLTQSGLGFGKVLLASVAHTVGYGMKAIVYQYPSSFMEAELQLFYSLHLM